MYGGALAQPHSPLIIRVEVMAVGPKFPDVPYSIFSIVSIVRYLALSIVK